MAATSHFFFGGFCSMVLEVEVASFLFGGSDSMVLNDDDVF